MKTKPPQGVDCHAHVFSATIPAVPGAQFRPAYAATRQDWQSHWSGSGITRGVLVQPSFLGTDNSQMLAAVRADPVRLRAVALVDASATPGDLAALRDRGVRAVRLNLHGIAAYGRFAEMEWKALYRRLAAAGMHIEVLVDSGRLPEIFEAFEGVDIPVVFDHFGNPGRDERAVDRTFQAVSAMARSRPVWCKLSAPYRLDGSDPRALAQRWLEAVGPRQLVWGSDWPWTAHEAGQDYSALRAALDDWLGERAAGPVLWDNAARLYRFH